MSAQDFYNVASPVGGVIGAIGNVVSTAMNNNTQIKLQQQANEWNAQMAAQANQWSIDQWNRENEYNSPVNQMKRLQEAGINPALAYSNGVFNQAATSPDVQTPSAAHAARTQAAQIDPNLFANLRVAESQANLLDEQADAVHDANKRENEFQGYRLKLTQSETNHFDALSSYLGELESYTKENKEYVAVLGATAALEFNKKMATLNSDIQAIKDKNRITHEQAKNIHENIVAQINLLKAHAHELSTRADVNNELKEYYKSLESYYDNSLTALNTSQELLNNSMRGNFDARTEKIPFDKWMEGIGMGLNVIHEGMDVFATIASRGQKPEIVFGSSTALPYPSSGGVSGGSFSSTRNGKYSVTGDFGGKILKW